MTTHALDILTFSRQHAQPRRGTFALSIICIFLLTVAPVGDLRSPLQSPIAHASSDTFNSSDTWTAPAGVCSVTVNVWGAGGDTTTVSPAPTPSGSVTEEGVDTTEAEHTDESAEGESGTAVSDTTGEGTEVETEATDMTEPAQGTGAVESTEVAETTVTTDFTDEGGSLLSTEPEEGGEETSVEGTSESTSESVAENEVSIEPEKEHVETASSPDSEAEVITESTDTTEPSTEGNATTAVTEESTTGATEPEVTP